MISWVSKAMLLKIQKGNMEKGNIVVDAQGVSMIHQVKVRFVLIVEIMILSEVSINHGLWS